MSDVHVAKTHEVDVEFQKGVPLSALELLADEAGVDVSNIFRMEIDVNYVNFYVYVRIPTETGEPGPIMTVNDQVVLQVLRFPIIR